MKLIIDISEEDYKECKFRKDLLSLGGEPTDLTFNMRMETLIANGTPLPEGHGRLIDADAYREKIFRKFPCNDRDDSNIRRLTEMAISDAPTIIEADKEN